MFWQASESSQLEITARRANTISTLGARLSTWTEERSSRLINKQALFRRCSCVCGDKDGRKRVWVPPKVGWMCKQTPGNNGPRALRTWIDNGSNLNLVQRTRIQNEISRIEENIEAAKKAAKPYLDWFRGRAWDCSTSSWTTSGCWDFIIINQNLNPIYTFRATFFGKNHHGQIISALLIDLRLRFPK